MLVRAMGIAENLSGCHSQQSRADGRDTSTEVGPLVKMGIIGPKISETRQLCSAIRSQINNYPNEWKFQSASSRGHPGRDKR